MLGSHWRHLYAHDSFTPRKQPVFQPYDRPPLVYDTLFDIFDHTRKEATTHIWSTPTCLFDALVRNVGVMAKRDGMDIRRSAPSRQLLRFILSLLFLSFCDFYLQFGTKAYIRAR